MRNAFISATPLVHMMMRQPAIVEEEPNNAINYPTEQRVERMFAALKNRISIQPVFIRVILPDKDSPIYVPFKRFCDMKIRIVSQGMVKPRQLNDQYLGNLALKINSKPWLQQRIGQTSSITQRK
ncbi:hypothetical protein M758_UG039500 [Ceratodon purpureus]|nr:hypothetical protein M758_UG039500 [Ceratodon purpureus]